MSDKPTESPQRLRSALDRVLVHDIKNMGFRLQMLLSNLDEHYDDPEFKRSVQELLRIDGRAAGRHRRALRRRTRTRVLIKVALDLNGVLREVAGDDPPRRRRGSAAAGPADALARAGRDPARSGATPTTCATPSRAWSRTRSRRRPREARSSSGASPTSRTAPAGGRRDHRQRVGDVAGVPARPALQALPDDEAPGRRARPLDSGSRSSASTTGRSTS